MAQLKHLHAPSFLHRNLPLAVAGPEPRDVAVVIWAREVVLGLDSVGRGEAEEGDEGLVGEVIRPRLFGVGAECGVWLWLCGAGGARGQDVERDVRHVGLEEAGVVGGIRFDALAVVREEREVAEAGDGARMLVEVAHDSVVVADSVVVRACDGAAVKDGCVLWIAVVIAAVAAHENVLRMRPDRIRDGSRKITYITEVQHMEGNTITTQDLFKFVQTGFDENGKALGHFACTGLKPSFLDKFALAGIELPEDFFDESNPEGRDYM